MDFSLTDRQRLIKQTAAEFAQKEIAPRVAAYYRERRFPYDLIKKMADRGYRGYGGCRGKEKDKAPYMECGDGE